MKMKSLPLNATIGELYEPAMTIESQEEADAYFAALVARQLKLVKVARARAEKVERENLGYYAGYFDSATRQRVEKLFRCEHPYFGPIAKNGQPTPEQALAAGFCTAIREGRR
jgi:hypothetical protein